MSMNNFFYGTNFRTRNKKVSCSIQKYRSAVTKMYEILSRFFFRVRKLVPYKRLRFILQILARTGLKKSAGITRSVNSHDLLNCLFVTEKAKCLELTKERPIEVLTRKKNY